MNAATHHRDAAQIWRDLTDKRRVLLVDLHRGKGLECVWGAARVRQLHELQRLDLIVLVDPGSIEERIEVTPLGHAVATVGVTVVHGVRTERGSAQALRELANELEHILSTIEAETVPYTAARPSKQTEQEHFARGLVAGFLRAESVVRVRLRTWGYVPASEQTQHVAVPEGSAATLRDPKIARELQIEANQLERRTERMERKAESSMDPALAWRRLVRGRRRARRIAYCSVLLRLHDEPVTYTSASGVVRTVHRRFPHLVLVRDPEGTSR